MSRHLGILILIALAGCDSSNKPARDKMSDIDKQILRKPRAFLFEAHAFLPLERVRGGLVFALWDDNTLVRRDSNEDPDPSYSLGQLHAADRAGLIRAVEEAVRSMPEDYRLPIDTGGYQLSLRAAGATMERATEVPPPAAIRKLEQMVVSLSLSNSEAIDWTYGVPGSWWEP